MFESLSHRLQGVFRSLRGQGVLNEARVDAALREIRLALLEADVHFKVVKQLLARVREKAVGEQVLKSLTPDQAVLRIVRDELVDVLGGAPPARLARGSQVPAGILMTGLQGSGKTTSSVKLAAWLAKAGHHPLLVSTDVQRPAAREQLSRYGEAGGVKVHRPASDDPREILRLAIAEARSVGHEYLIVDTAGRLHVDDALMQELADLKQILQPSEVLYVADAMTGQDAVRSAEEFSKRVGMTGIVLSKLDGDARGGAALSAASVTGCPVRFAGVGEKPGDLEPFLPERMVGRVLGAGDVLGLIEKAEQAIDHDQAQRSLEKLRRNQFSLEDYRDQLRQIGKLGSLESLLKMLPGFSQLKDVDTEQGEREMKRAGAIIDSMTPRERREPALINGSRRRRIAGGSGTRVEDVNRLLKQFQQARKMMKGFSGGKGRKLKQLASSLPREMGF